MKKITLLLFALMAFTFGQSQNLALNKTATASSVSGTNTADKAIDGNTGTRWESVVGPAADWTVDLGASYNIGQVIIKWEGAYGTVYTIEISPDNVNWTTIYTETAGNGGTDDLPVSGTGRYVKYNGTARALVYGHSFWEFEVYEAVEPLTDATLSNLTVNGTTVTDFSSNTLNYNVELPSGTTVVPTVVATTSQASPASAVVTNATSLPGTTSVLATAQNGTDTKTYTINFTVAVTQVSRTFDLTFEPGTTGSDASKWNVFENAGNPALEVVANPNASGVNTSATVAKMTTIAGDAGTTTGGKPWAGTESQHGTIWKWKLDGTTTTITIDVYKTVISDVGIKMVNVGTGTVFQLVKPNTVTNAWETLSYDISSFVASGENNNVDQIVVFPDWQDPRATDNVTYFDNISWEGLITGAAPTLGTTSFKIAGLKVFPNPSKNSWNIKTSNINMSAIKVYDILGKNVLSLTPNATDATINGSSLKAGLYFAQIKTANGVSSIKLVKE